MNRSDKQNRIALKPYLESISTDCSKLSKQELTDLILNLAKSESAAGRTAFLSKFRSFLPGEGTSCVPETDVEELLHDVQALREDIEERIAAIEEGDYEELDDFDWEDLDYHDEEPDFVSEEQFDELEDLFHRADELFVNQKIQDAKMVYEALFQLHDYIAEYEPMSFNFQDYIREERARYARCVYDAPAGTSRVKEFAQAMALDALGKHRVDRIDAALPLFQDVIDAREEEVEDIQSFYLDWKEFLEKREMGSRAASLLIEAVHYLEGTVGVARLARKWGNAQPYGYLFWMRSLLQEDKFENLIEVSEEALRNLEPGEAREKASEFLIEAGKLSGSRDHVLKGKREKLFSNPNDVNLLALLNEAVEHNAYTDELSAVLAFWAEHDGMGANEKSLYLKSLLIAGRFEDALRMVKAKKSIGWSYGLNIGMVFGAVALTLADWSEDARITRKLLAEYAERKEVYSLPFADEDNDDGPGYYERIIKTKDRVQLSGFPTNEYLDWVFDIGRERIDHIVSNKHRKAYARAAQVLGALAEVCKARGEDSEATRIIREYCQEKYSRHSAFKREVEDVLQTSGYRLVW